MIYCVMVSGDTLTDDIRDVLFDIAQEMYEKDRRAYVLSSSLLEGMVTTEYKSVLLGDTAGFLFHAQMEWEEGDVEVGYIVRPTDLRSVDMGWMSPGEALFPGHTRN